MAAAVLATVVAIFLWARLPPAQQRLASTFADGTVAGVLHIHSSHSDGRGTPGQIAHDAARAGLKFIVITDHGDATQAPEPPVYREGVLCLEGTEISTSGGHYIAIDMPASPYPLGGEARDVVDDVKRMGGFGIVAHPDSPKPELRWKEWSAPFDAIEIFNLDTSWRQRVTETSWRPKAGLISRLLTYPFRPTESITSLITRSNVLYRWDALAGRRHLVTIAGADAHAQIAWRASDPVSARLSVPVPSYESSFRALSVHVRTERSADRNGRDGRRDDRPRDSRRTSIYGGRRRGDAAVIRVHGQQPARHGAAGGSADRVRSGHPARPQQCARRVHDDDLERHYGDCAGQARAGIHGDGARGAGGLLGGDSSGRPAGRHPLDHEQRHLRAAG